MLHTKNNEKSKPKQKSSYKYKVETHLHTCQASECAVNTGAEMARACKRGGYCAICVTDHFFNGNTAIRGRNYSWGEKIAFFTEGYEDAHNEGAKIGLDVYFGFEFNYYGAEFLIYNYSADKLREYPEIMTDDIELVLTNIKNEGGYIIHAHPFRNEYYIQAPGKIFPEYTDGVEVVNTHNRRSEENRLALEYAEKYNLIKFGGSDTHSAAVPAYIQEGGMLFARKPESIADMLEMARKEECIILGENDLI